MRFLIFACLGVGIEILFTGIRDRKKSVKLQGYSYLWMFPLWALVPLYLDHIYPMVKDFYLIFRLAIYTSLLMPAEYAAGWSLRKLVGVCPWEDDYKNNKWSVHDLVRIDYIPLWFVACYIIECVYIHEMSLTGV